MELNENARIDTSQVEDRRGGGGGGGGLGIPIPIGGGRGGIVGIVIAVLVALVGGGFGLNAMTGGEQGDNTALEQRWIGQSAGRFFAAYGPPLRDMEAADGTTLYSWRGGYINRKVCQVEIGVNSNYEIRKIRTVVDRKDPKGGPSHCEKFLDAAK